MTSFRPPFYTLRAKLLLFSFFLVLVPGLLVALIAFVGARRVIENAAGRQLAEVAHDTAGVFEDTLARERRNVGMWARQEVMREIVVGDIDKRISRFLGSLKEGGPGYVDLLCVDANGRVVAASEPGLVGERREDSSWYRAALRGEPYLAGPVPWPSHHGPVLLIAAPIDNPDAPGDALGVLLGVYDWRERSSALVERLEQDLLPLRIRVDILVLDETGLVIAESADGVPLELKGMNLRDVGWRAAQRRVSQRPGFASEKRAGVLVGYAGLDSPGPPWTVLVAQPRREALAPLYRMQHKLLLALAAVLLVAFGIAVLLAERMSGPLRELTQATQEIARVGEPRRPIPVRSRDEIGQLAGAFNVMVGDLKRAQDDLLAAARFAFLGEIAAGVAHEVRTPLGSLRTSAQILRRSLPFSGAADAELIDIIIGEVDRLDRVVAQLLEIAGPHEPAVEPVDLPALLDRVLDFVDARATEKKIAVQRQFPRAMRPALCDPEQIYQVALNLIVNALQVLAPGGHVTVRVTAAGPDRVAFEVSDDGPGIPPELKERIFTPFFTTRKEGTGLGLALVQRMVRANHGTVSVESERGRGATFRVELPAANLLLAGGEAI